MTGAGSFIAFRQRNKNSQKIGKIEGFGVEVKVNSEATRMVRVSLTSFIHTDFLASNSLSLVIRMSPFLLAQGGYLSLESFTICFREKCGNGEVRVIFLFLLLSQPLQPKIFNLPRRIFWGSKF